jgi:hypothetical protein
MPGRQVSIGNIGRVGERRRRILGTAALAAAALVLFYLDTTHATRWSRAIVFPLFWSGCLGWFQAQARTCVWRAGQGVCELDNGSVTPVDADKRELLWRRGKGLLRRSAIVAAALTSISIAVP